MENMYQYVRDKNNCTDNEIEKILERKNTHAFLGIRLGYLKLSFAYREKGVLFNRYIIVLKNIKNDFILFHF